jgi:flagellar protein FlaJ
MSSEPPSEPELPQTAAPTPKSEPQQKTRIRLTGEVDYSGFAYRVFGSLAAKSMQYFEGLDLNLKRAGIKLTLVKYISKIYMTAFIALIAGILVPIPILYLLNMQWLFIIITSIALGFIAAAVAFIVIYVYPSYVLKNRKNAIDKNLSFITNYLAILAGAGVIPEKIFKSVAKSDVDPAIRYEVSEIIRRMEVFGEDFYTALSVRIDETPSTKFAELLRGILLVGSTGGDMKRYLFLQGKRFIRFKNIDMRKSLDNLGIMAEVYVTAGIVLPLIMVVMLATLSFLGGGGINAIMWLYLVTYLMVPFIAVMMLLMIDSTVPSET